MRKQRTTRLVLALILTLSFTLPVCTASAATLTQGPVTSASATATSATISWKPVSGATSYDLELYTAENYQKMLKENGAVARYTLKYYGLKTNSWTLTLQPGSYVVTVAAVNATSWKFGNAVSFTVGATRWLHGVQNWKQYDGRWNTLKLGANTTIGAKGCLLTAVTMAESYRTQTCITPAQMLSRVSFSGNNLIWPSQYTSISQGLNLRLIYDTINSGKPVIIGGETKYGNTHWVIVVGYVNANPANLTAGMFAINDPSSTNTSLATYLNTYSRVLCMKTYK